ncbi:Cloroperoxidase [Paxillus ammoniavirescens]|nr:Cloroperoxidase [Paxillus ammoniavirescens]
MNPFNALAATLYTGGILTWDVLLTLLNIVQFKRPVGKVTPRGHPGFGGQWPEYKPPQEGDSRCSCPALNAMANHGIISRSGRDIKFTDLSSQIRTTYNFSATFCSFVPHYAARMLNKSYSKDVFDLQQLDLHNGIEHDASLIRFDTAFQPDQSIKDVSFINEMLNAASGKDRNGNAILTVEDLSKISGKRRAEARATNKEFTLAFVHKIFGSTNASTLWVAFGGRVEDLKVFLLEERLPEGWESHIRLPHGLTIASFNRTIAKVELGIKEPDWTTDGGANTDDATNAH